MADISRLTRLINGAIRGIDLQSNALVVGSLKVGESTPTELSKTILDKLILTNTATDVDGTFDTRYAVKSTETAASDAQADATQALADAATADGKAVAAQADATQALADAATADGKAVAAQADATQALADAATADGKAVAAQADATQALADAATADGKAVAAQADATQALADAATAQAAAEAAQSDADDANAAIAQLASGQNFREYLQAITADSAPADDATLASVLPFSDDNAPQLVVGDFAANQYVMFDFDGTPKLMKIYDDEGTLTLTSVGVTQPVQGNCYHVKYNLPAGSDALEKRAIYGKSATVMIKIADEVWDSAAGIQLATWTSGAGVVASSDSVLAALQKIDGNTTAAQADATQALADAATADGKAVAAQADATQALADAATAQSAAEDAQTAAETAQSTAEAAQSSADDAMKASQEDMTCGEAFAASLFAVRLAKGAETTGRIYKADKDATTADNFHVVGLVLPATPKSAGGIATMFRIGNMNIPSHGFTVGLPLYLDAAGVLTQTPPSTENHAVKQVGIVRDADNIEVQILSGFVN